MALWLIAVSLLLPGRVLAENLVNLLPSLYGGDGILLHHPEAGEGFSHAAHFTDASLSELNQLSKEIASALNFASLNSTVTGFTFDLELGVPVQTQESLGPLLGERSATLGAHKLNVAFNYTRVDYDLYQGEDLHDLQLVFPHADSNGDGVLAPFIPPGGGDPVDVELDTIAVDLDLRLSQDVMAFFGTYGLLPRLDVGVVVPVIHTDLTADAMATIVQNNVCCPGIHRFDPSQGQGQDDPRSSVQGSATGIGDVLLRAKYHLPTLDKSWAPQTAVLFEVKPPTGDEKDLLGTGDTRLTPMLIIDRTFWRVTPHVNFGFQFVPGHASRQAFRLLAGCDFQVDKRLTVAPEFLGRFEPAGDGIGDELLDFSIGAKLNLWRSLLLVGNTLFPLNRNQGLRPNVVWSVGFEYTFGVAD